MRDRIRGGLALAVALGAAIAIMAAAPGALAAGPGSLAAGSRAPGPVARATRVGSAPARQPLTLDLPLRTDTAGLARFAAAHRGRSPVTIRLPRRARAKIATALRHHHRVTAYLYAAIVDPTGKIVHHTHGAKLPIRGA